MKKLSVFLFLLAAPAFAMRGTPGHINVEVSSSVGWVQAGELAFGMDQDAQSLAFPAALPDGKHSLKIRLTQKDNDETQLDRLTLTADGKALKADGLTLEDKDVSAKLGKLDRDVIEIHGLQLMAGYRVPAGAKALVLELTGRSSKSTDLPALPFRIMDQDKSGKARPYRLEAKEGAKLDISLPAQHPGSGHPSAPIEVSLKVAAGKLRGTLDFGPDNDPGADDYGAVVATGAKGDETFKITPFDRAWGRARWDYAKAAKWQHMVYDIDIPLAKLPRQADGSLGLGLLAYGTCSLSGPDFFCGYLNSTGSNVAGDAVTITAYLCSPFATGYNGVTISGHAACYVMDSGGNTVFSEIQPVSALIGAPNPWNTYYFYPACPDTYKAMVNEYSDSDPDPGNGYNGQVRTFVITGPCATATPSPTATPTPLFKASNQDKPILGPNPVTRGDLVCAYFDKQPASASWQIYNLAGDKVADLSFGGQEDQCWSTKKVTPGVYFIRLDVKYADGGSAVKWLRAAIK